MTSPRDTKRPLGVTIIAIIAAQAASFHYLVEPQRLLDCQRTLHSRDYRDNIRNTRSRAVKKPAPRRHEWARVTGIAIYIVPIGLGGVEILYGGNVGFIGGIIRVIA